MFKTGAKTGEGERARTAPELFFCRGCARKRRTPEEMLAVREKHTSSLTAQEQETYYGAGKPTRTALRRFFWS